MIEKVILHIGAHKTGSSYLQARFCQAREILFSKGILYPRIWQTLLWGHHILIPAIDKQQIESPELIWQQIKAEADSDTKIVILSSENFEYASEKVIDWLAAAIPQQVEKQIVFFVRKWSELLPSAWQESVKHGNTKEYPQFILEHLCSPYSSKILNFNKVCKNYTKFFEQKDLKIVFYDVINNNEEDIFEFFLQEFCEFNEKIESEIAGKKINKSLESRDIEILRCMNILARQNKHPHPQQIRKIFFAEKNNIKERKELWEILSDFYSEFQINNVGVIPSQFFNNFIKEYQGCLVNQPYDDFLKPNKKFNFIDSSYLLNKLASQKIHTIYEQLYGVISSSLFIVKGDDWRGDWGTRGYGENLL
ncbi:MAG: hypothetical protein Kow0049_16770 [Stanieria sp.]